MTEETITINGIMYKVEYPEGISPEYLDVCREQIIDKLSSQHQIDYMDYTQNLQGYVPPEGDSATSSAVDADIETPEDSAILVIPTNLLLNAGFETADADGNAPVNWTFYSNTASAWRKYPEPGRLGGNSVSLFFNTRQTGKYVILYQTVNVDPTKTYVFRGYTKNYGVSGTGAKIKVDWKRNDGTYISESELMPYRSTATDATWQYFGRYVYPPSAEAVKASIVMILYDASGKTYFDDITFSQTKYNCVSGTCVENDDGVYDKKSICLASCGTPVLDDIIISFTDTSIVVGENTQATFSCKDQFNAPITCPTLSWTSTVPSVATVSTTGNVHGVSAGTTNIQAHYTTPTVHSNLVTITVTPVVVASEHPKMFLNSTEIDTLKSNIALGTGGGRPWASAWSAFQSKITSALAVADNPPTVVTYTCCTPAGCCYPDGWDIHDFVSGTHDHMKQNDYKNALITARAIRDLGIAYQLETSATLKTQYANAAVKMIYYWCIKSTTYMRPDGPAITAWNAKVEIPVAMIPLFYGADMIWNYSNWTFDGIDVKAKLRIWTQKLINAIKTSINWGTQNRATWRHACVAAGAALLDDNPSLTWAFNEFKRLVPLQIDNSPLGRMKDATDGVDAEWRREKPISYSLFTIFPMVLTAEIAKHRPSLGFNLYSHKVSPTDNRGLELALDVNSQFCYNPNLWTWTKFKLMPCSWKVTPCYDIKYKCKDTPLKCTKVDLSTPGAYLNDPLCGGTCDSAYATACCSDRGCSNPAYTMNQSCGDTNADHWNYHGAEYEMFEIAYTRYYTASNPKTTYKNILNKNASDWNGRPAYDIKTMGPLTLTHGSILM